MRQQSAPARAYLPDCRVLSYRHWIVRRPSDREAADSPSIARRWVSRRRRLAETRYFAVGVAKLEGAGEAPPRACTGAGDDQQPDGLLTDLSPHWEQRANLGARFEELP